MKKITHSRQVITVFIYLFFLLAFAPALYAATYYVDATLGKDTNDGLLQTTAWKTIAKVNASRYNRGDQILFKRGEIWREQLVVPSSGSSGSPITFGAYGGGELPTITGADILDSGWTQTTSTVWQASVTTEPKMVFFNGTIGTQETSIRALAGANEWYWASNVLYVYSTSNPRTAYTSPGIEAGARDYGILVSRAYITIQDIHTTKANSTGLRMDDIWAGYGTIYSPQAIRVTSDYNYVDGIMVGADGANIQDALVQGCTCSYNGNRGIYVGNWDGTINGVTIQDNIVDHNTWIQTSSDTMIDAGIYLATPGGGGEQYVQTLTNAIVQRNTITNCTYQNGLWIDTVGANVVVRNNILHDNYNGGIIEYSDGVQWYYNLFYNNTNLGFQVTRLVHSNEIYNNTVYGCGTGIAVGWTDPSAGGVTGNLIKNNISWGNRTAAFAANYGGENDGTNGSGNVYANNIFGPEATNFIAWGASRYNTLAAWRTASSQTGNLASNPLFVSIATPDFHLLSSSPAIKAGTSVGLTRDYAGSTVGTPPTIGAYEYYGLSAPTGLRIIP